MSETMIDIPDERQIWEAARRIESFAGEIRVNRLRLAAIIIFYARHLIDIYLNPLNRQFSGRYHLWVTFIVLAWTAEVIWLHWALSHRRVGEKLKFISVIWDLVMVTMLGIVAGGPKTPLMLLYFIVIASAPLRMSLRVVWVATLGAMAGDAIVVMYYAWYVIGFHKYYATPEVRLSRSAEFIWFLSLGVAGLLAGQVVRQMRRLTGGYAVAIGDQKES
jgi:hypothetical protein